MPIFLDPEYDGSFRPNTLGSDTTTASRQYYNLQNQSWGIPRKDEDGVLSDPVKLYQQDLGKFPSNEEVVWTGLQFQPVTATEDPYERMFTNLYDDSLGSGLKAAKGYFIIDLLRRGVSRAEAFAANQSKYPQLNLYASLNTVADYTTGGPKIITSFAGRIFFAGFNGAVVDGDIRSPSLNNSVAFSQLVKNKKDIIKCYQEGDPTSRDGSDLVDTDGGIIKVDGAEDIKAMLSLGASLAIFAANGVWVLSGGSDYGFTATNYKLDKITSYGCASQTSVVETGGKAYYWSNDGIFVLAKNQFGDYEVSSLTETTIQTFYQLIPAYSKENVVGVYDGTSKKIRWVYHEGVRFSSTSEQRELIFDVVTGAFTKNRVFNSTTNDKEVYALFYSNRLFTGSGQQEVVVGSDDVYTGVDQVVTDAASEAVANQSTRYLVLSKVGSVYSYSFALYNNTLFKDWNEVDAVGYMLTGGATTGDSSIKKQVPYLTVHLYKTEEIDAGGELLNESSCLFRVQWNWSLSELSNKWSRQQQAYKLNPRYFSDSNIDNGFSIVTTRNKVRGIGRAFAVRFDTEAGKDCQLVGWNMAVNGNATT